MSRVFFLLCVVSLTFACKSNRESSLDGSELLTTEGSEFFHSITCGWTVLDPSKPFLKKTLSTKYQISWLKNSKNAVLQEEGYTEQYQAYLSKFTPQAILKLQQLSGRYICHYDRVYPYGSKPATGFISQDLIFEVDYASIGKVVCGQNNGLAYSGSVLAPSVTPEDSGLTAPGTYEASIPKYSIAANRKALGVLAAAIPQGEKICLYYQDRTPITEKLDGRFSFEAKALVLDFWKGSLEDAPLF